MFGMRSSLQVAIKKAKMAQKQEANRRRRLQQIAKDRELKKKLKLSKSGKKIHSALGTLWNDVADELCTIEKLVKDQESALTQTKRWMHKADRVTDSIETHHLASQLVWKIGGFRRILRNQGSTGRLIYSPKFASHPSGYRMMCSFCLVEKDGTEYVSLMVCMVRGEYDDLLPWPFAIPITFSILEQTELDADTGFRPSDRQHISKTLDSAGVNEHTKAFEKPKQAFGLSVGFRYFVEKEKIMCERYIVNDVIFIQLTLDRRSVANLRAQQCDGEDVDEPVAHSEDGYTYWANDGTPELPSPSVRPHNEGMDSALGTDTESLKDIDLGNINLYIRSEEEV